MARNGSGTYSLPSGNPVVTGSVISSATHNTTMSDIATALTGSLAKDGQTTPSANLPMGGYKHTGVAVAAARDQYATAGQVQDGSLTVLGSVSGSDTITATAPVLMAAYAAGQSFSFTAAGANTGAVTLNVNSLGAKSVTKGGTSALVAGDIPSGAVARVEYDGTRFQLLNPVNTSDALLASLAGQTVAANKIQAYSAADTASLLDFKDEDDMASNSATAVPSQQSVKAYVDTQIATVAAPNSVISYTGTGGVTAAGTGYSFGASFPLDASKPQISEGAPALDVTITPGSVGEVIEIESVIQMGGGGASVYTLCAALFKDSDADALTVGYRTSQATTADVGPVHLLYRYTSTGTSAVTFKVRVGAGGSAATQYVNRSATTSNLFGDISSSFIKATVVG